MTDVPPEPQPDPTLPVEEFLGDVEQVSEWDGDFTLSDEGDLPPSDDDDAILVDEPAVQIGDGVCIVCGAPTFRPPGLTPTGRKKRTPKYCDLHATNPRIPRERQSSARVEVDLRRVQEELADDIRLLGTLAGPLLPVTGYYVFTQADPFTMAILKLAKNNQRVIRILHRAATIAPIYTVAETVAGTAYAIQVDQHKADPHSNISRRLGVSQAYDSVYSESTSSTTNNGSTPTTSGPPKYSTV